MTTEKPVIISIEGNIGSGKSTLVDRLKDIYQHKGDIHFLQEPVDMWNTITDDDGCTILEKYYENQDKYAFSFQMMAYISRISILKKAIRESGAKVIITERCVYTDANVFAKMLFDDKKIGTIEYKIYRKWFDEFVEDMPISNIIYVKTEPTTAFERVIKRNRHGETIPISYLESCHRYHENWLNNTDISMLTLNGDVDCDESPEVLSNWLTEINSFIATNSLNSVRHKNKSMKAGQPIVY